LDYELQKLSVDEESEVIILDDIEIPVESSSEKKKEGKQHNVQSHKKGLAVIQKNKKRDKKITKNTRNVITSRSQGTNKSIKTNLDLFDVFAFIE